MSIICWDGKAMAADRRGTVHGTCFQVQKLWRLEVPGWDDPILWGAAGKAWQIAEMLAWFRAGRPPEKFPESQRNDDDCGDIMVVTKQGQMLWWQRGPEPFEVFSIPWAIGSGRDMALGAMHAGASAGQAVEICCEYESGCGEGVDLLSLDGT